MELTDVIRDLAFVGEVVEGWQRDGAISEIERDMVLERLRRVYVDLKFAEPTAPVVVAPPTPAIDPIPFCGIAEVVTEPETEPNPDPDPAPIRKTLMSLYDNVESPVSHALSDRIDLNERIGMVRDLFDGDAAAFEDAIDRLDSFTGLDDAMLYIYENFAWNPDDPSVRRLVDLLTQKLA